MEIKEYFDSLIALNKYMGGSSTGTQLETEDGYIITVSVKKKNSTTFNKK